MQNNRIHILPLVLFHLILLLNPLVLKSVHRDNLPVTQNAPGDFTKIANHQDVCLICQFEFVNVIIASPEKYEALIVSNPVIVPVTRFHLLPEPFCCFQHRAPPSMLS